MPFNRPFLTMKGANGTRSRGRPLGAGIQPGGQAPFARPGGPPKTATSTLLRIQERRRGNGASQRARRKGPEKGAVERGRRGGPSKGAVGRPEAPPRRPFFENGRQGTLVLGTVSRPWGLFSWGLSSWGLSPVFGKAPKWSAGTPAAGKIR
ncbi:hypothetical protein M885DRAFT_531201 [Pelagophyceae sp. CCMP2097]|nr:hypothetical protein M885DRAFT_531201 [Pelagophyceae sp. CCMP2097]